MLDFPATIEPSNNEPTVTDMEKICTKCGECKPATTEFFHSSKSHSGGLKSACKSCVNLLDRIRWESRKDYVLQKQKQYKHENREQIRDKGRAYWRESGRSAKRRSRAIDDPIFMMKERIRAGIKKAFRMTGNTKTGKTLSILGITGKGFADHIESQFLDGMTWENRSEWHIDHIIPLATAKTEEDVIRLNHYTNLRPLWAIDNLKKGARLDWTQTR